MPWEPLQGDVAELGGYRLSGRLGAGGMGHVYLAFTPAGRPVALKVLRPELGDDPEFRARFRQEVAAARRVNGLFTAQVLDADPDGSPPWLVTAYVAGQSLAQAVVTHGPLPEHSVLLLAAGVAEALQGIHAAGLVHRDLKPSNVLLAADGPRVIDFGIARAAQAPALTRAGFRMGSPQFMAPEQVRGDAVDPAADVFALGALAAYAATGRRPFGDDHAAAVMFRVVHASPDLEGCPGVLLPLITGCMAKDPSARPAPSAVIDYCRARMPAGTLEFSASWLPQQLAADLPGHGASGTPPLPLPSLPPSVAAPAAPAGLAIPRQPEAPRSSSPTARATVAAPAHRRRRRRRRPRVALTASVAAGLIVAALAGYGLKAVADSGSGNAKAAPRAAAAAVDPCLLGTWTLSSLASPQVPGGRVLFGDHGPTAVFRADGVVSVDYGAGTTVTIRVGSVTWTAVYSGGFTARYATKDGALQLRDNSGVGSYTLLRDGAYYFGGSLPSPLRAAVSEPYTCSADTLQLLAPGGAAEALTRGAPQT
jgi:hypothetical protein